LTSAIKATAHIQTSAEYFVSLPKERRTLLTAIHRAIRKAAPTLRPHIAYGMLAYGDCRYRSAKGHESTGPVIALANQKQHISLYMSCEEDGSLAVEDKKRLGKVSTGKCCIRFKKLEDLNLRWLWSS